MAPTRILRLGIAVLMLGPGAMAVPPPFSSSPVHFTNKGVSLFFSADSGLTGRELYYVDVRVPELLFRSDIEPGPGSANPRQIMPLETIVVFMADTKTHGTEPWFFDLRTRRAQLLTDLTPGPSSSQASLIPLSSETLLVLWTTLSQGQLGVLKYPSVEIVPLTSIAFAEGPGWAHLEENRVLFSVRDGLASTDGTKQGTHLIRLPLRSPPEGIVSLGNRAVMSVQGAEGNELWCYNETSREAHLVREIRPGPTGANIGQTTAWQGRAFFHADDGEHGLELWVSDGTAEGTFMLKDIASGGASSDPHYFKAAGNRLFFVADDGEHGNEIWCTDGTPEGTRLAGEVNPGPASGDIWSLAGTGTDLYFAATSLRQGEELFRMPTETLTPQCLDLMPGPNGCGPNHLSVTQEGLIFSGVLDQRGEEPCILRWTAPDKALVIADIALTRPEAMASASPEELTDFHGKLVFSANDLKHGREPWISGGAEENTFLLEDIYPGETDSAAQGFVAGDHKLYFAATAPDSGRELWLTEGLPGTTRIAADVRPGFEGSDPENLVTVGDRVYFAARNKAGKRELWVYEDRSDLAQRLWDGQNTKMTLGNIFAFDRSLYFYLQETGGKITLWKVQDSGHSVRECSPELRSLRMDDPVPDTRRMAILTRLFPYGSVRMPQPQQLNGEYYFTAQVPDLGAELFHCKPDLSQAELVADLFPGPSSSSPSCLTPWGEALYFVASLPRRGRVLCFTDGQPGHAQMADVLTGTFTAQIQPRETAVLSPDELLTIAPHPVQSELEKPTLFKLVRRQESLHFHNSFDFPLLDLQEVRSLTVCGGRVFFVCNLHAKGMELWVFDQPDAAPHLVRDIMDAKSDARP